MVSIGDVAPNFELPNQDGKLIRLSDLRGRPVVIFAFPAAGTLGCTMQACSFRDAFPQIEGASGVVLGVSADTQADLKAWKQRQKLPYDLMSDPEHVFLDAYGAWGRSVFGLVTLKMIVRSYWVIDAAGRIADLEINTGATNSITKALKALNALPQA